MAVFVLLAIIQACTPLKSSKDSKMTILSNLLTFTVPIELALLLVMPLAIPLLLAFM
jgi:hypothetical protein